MPEALARADHDFVLSEPAPARRKAGPAREAARAMGPAAQIQAAKPRRKAPTAPNWRSRLFSTPGRTLIYGAVAAVALGIVVNATSLQKTRHPAPLFVAPAAKSEPTPAQSAPVAPLPVARPQTSEPAAPRAASAEPALVDKPRGAKPDPIAQLLIRPHVGAGDANASKSVLDAQRALQKLGYVLRPDGVFGGTTRQAIEQFERDRGLPIKGDLTPKLRRELAAQSGIAIQ